MGTLSTRSPPAKPARSGETARELIRRTKQVTRRKFPAEEKIRILLERIRAGGLVEHRPQPGTVWNRLRPEEEAPGVGQFSIDLQRQTERRALSRRSPGCTREGQRR